MPQLIIRSRRPEEIRTFVKTNSPSQYDPSAGQALKAFQKANGGTGDTFYDLQHSWLSAQGYTSLSAYLYALGYTYGVLRERIRVFLANLLTPPATSYYLLEDGTSKYLLEDGSGSYILE